MPDLNWECEWPEPRFSLLGEGGGNQNALKQFLQEEAWKLLLAGPGNVIRKNFGRTEVHIPVCFPDHFDEFVRRCARRSVSYKASKLGKDVWLAGHQDKSIGRVVPSVQIRQRRLQIRNQDRVINTRKLIDWLRLYFVGQAFALAVSMPEEDRYIFIEELYGEPEEYHSLKEHFLGTGPSLTILSGVPKMGKSYTALRLLYDAFVLRRDQVILLVREVRTFGDRLLDEIARVPSGTQVYAHLDDPFGKDRLDLEGTRRLIDELQRWREDNLPLHLVITTREEVLRAAERMMPSLGSLVGSAYKVDFRTASIGSERTASYSLPTLERILENIAWLTDATWFEHYRHYRQQRRSTEDSDVMQIWRDTVKPDTAPGTLLAALILHPHVLHLSGNAPNEIRSIKDCVASADDLKAALHSELTTILGREESNLDAATLLYILLPSMTLVRDTDLTALFGENLSRLNQYGRLFETRHSHRAYELTSRQYIHDALADAARAYLRDKGSRLFVESLLPFLAQRADKAKNERSPIGFELLSDILCTYYALGGQQNQEVQVLKDLLNEASQRWAKVIHAFFYVLHRVHDDAAPNTERPAFVSVQTYVPEIARLRDDQLSSLSSRLDQLLSWSSNVPTSSSVIGELVSSFVKETHRAEANNSGEAYFRTSLFLHGILAHMEDWFLREGGPALDQEPARIRQLVGCEEILRVLAERQGDMTSLNTSIVWLDALLMKIGELGFYLSEWSIQPSAEDQDAEGATALSYEERRSTEIGELVAALKCLFLEVWAATIEVSKLSQNASYVRSAMAFSAAWHNRWSVSGHVDKDLATWISSAKLFSHEAQDTGSWAGIGFNLEYHARYFEVKASAWERESTIYRSKRDRPRLGADALYEAGLIAPEVDPTYRPMQTEFYCNCIRHFIKNGEGTERNLESAAFVVGIRAPRDYDIRAAFAEAIEEQLGQTDDGPQPAFWVGICKLYLHGFKESQKTVENAIQERAETIPRTTLDAVLAIVEQTTKRIEDEIGVSGDLHALRQVLRNAQEDG